MRLNRRVLLALAATVAAGSLVSCDAPTRPPTTGRIVPRFVMVTDQQSTAKLVALTGMRATIRGTGSSTFTSFQELQAPATPTGSWTGTIQNVPPGTYEIIIEGTIPGGAIQHYGRSSSSITVVAGQQAPAPVQVQPVVPTVPTFSLADTTDFSRIVTLGTGFTFASGWEYQVSSDANFTGATTTPAAGTTFPVTVPDVGTWFVRVRPTLAFKSFTEVAWSDPQSFTVTASTGGRSSAAAQAQTLASGVPDTIVDRNITSTFTEGWYAFPARAGDSLFVTTRAAGLNPPSPLNTTVAIFRADGVTQIASNDNISGTNTDSRDSVVAPATENYLVRVGRAGNTVGHYDLILELRRLPAAPTGLAVIATSATSARVRWNDNADNEASYRIERCQGAGCANFAELGTAGAANDTSFTDGGLTAGATYSYRVRARNSIGNSAYAGAATVVLVGPAAPSALTATTISGSRIDLTWTDNSDNETGFEVQRCGNGTCAGDADFTVTNTVAAGVTAFSATGLSVDNSYVFRVRAVNNVAPSAFSATAAANTIRPPAPSGLTATTMSASRIDLAWSDNAGNETAFRIERCAGAGCSSFAEIGTTAANAVSYSDVTAQAETYYSYRVRASNVAGSSDPSNTALANTRAPGVPASFAASVVNATRVDLSWADTTAAETGFLVERCEGVGCAVFSTLTTAAAGSTGHTDNTVVSGNTYRYRVRATGVAGNSAEAGPVTAAVLPPAAPNGLTATTVSGTQVNLAWTDASDNETSFRIERCTGAACTAFAEVGFVSAGAVAYNDVGVTAENDYRYRVRARNAVDTSSATNIAAASTRSAGAPTLLTATQVSAAQIDLAWQDNADNETGFRIERCTGVGCANFAEIATVAANTLTYQNTGIGAGASYSYRVRAVNAVTASAPSNTATATTSAPLAPSGLTALTVSATRIDLGWTDGSVDELGFIIERCDGDGCSDFAAVDTAAAGATAFQDLTVAAGTAYRYRVRAFNPVGTSPYTTEVAADTREPQPPSGLTAATVSGTRIDLDWTDNAANELGVVIERCAGAGCTFVAIDTVGAGITAFSDLTVTVDQAYDYRVFAFNNAGVSNVSNTASANTLLPAAPSGLTATTQSATSAALSWTNNAVDADGFIIERCTGAGCSGFAAIDSTAGAVTDYTDTGLSAGATFTYQVRARNVAGRGAPSNAAEASTIAPNAPAGLTATTASATRIDLAWTDAATNETGFTVERCAGAACADFAPVATLPENTTAFQNTDLTPGLSYSYRVRAFNASGASAYSDVASASTNLPAAPTDFTAELISNTQIQLAWTDAATDETDYAVEWCQGVGCASFSQWVGALPPNTQSYMVVTDLPGETLRFRVRVTNSVGSAYSEIAQATFTAPASPTGLEAATRSTTRIDLSWADNSDNENGFVVHRCVGTGCEPFTGTVDTLPAGSVTYVDSTVTAGLIYRYRVRAYNNAYGPSAGGGVVAEATTILPADPTGFSATTFSSSQIDLAWTDNATNELGYEVERCTGVGCTDFVRVDSLAPNTASYSDVGLTPNLAYRYRVRAVNGAGGSAYTGIADATTNVPADPTGLVATATSPTAITITWTDNANNETDYQIQRCTVASCLDTDFADIALVGANVTQYVDGGFSLGQSATYRVKAVNLNGSSRYSNTAFASVTAPATPGAFTAVNVGANQVSLAWADLANNETGIEVERCAGEGCASFARIDSLPPNDTTYLDAATVLDETYSYRLRAVNRVGASGYTATATVNTIRPAAPTLLSATTLSATQVDLAWTDNAGNESGFEVERCTGAGCSDFAQLAVVAPDAVSYNDLTVTVGNVYQYRLRAVNIAGASAYVGPVPASTLLPADPTALGATVSAPTEITLTWTDNADNEASYRLERCSGVGCANFVQIATLPANSVQHVDGGLTGNTFYRYRLRAANAAGFSAYTAIVSPNTFAPAQPTGLVLTTVFGDRIDLTWSDPASNETGFRIERCTGAGCNTFVEIATVAANVTTHADSTLAFGTTYRYRVRSYNGVANSAYTDPAEGNTDVPLDPTGLSAAAQSTTRIDLAWVDNGTNETGYRIERCTGPGCSDFTLLAQLGADAVGYSDTPIAAGTSFTYRVRAFNQGSSGWSNAATATTILPADPTAATATAVAGDRIDLAWSDNADNEYGYEVERCTGAGCTDFAVVETTVEDVSSYSDTPLAGGLLYRYRIRAFNGAGRSGYTAVVEATTNVPGIPTTLTATTFDASRIDLAWADNATDELGFVIERCTGAGCTGFTAIDSVETPNATAYSNTGLAAGTTFRYRVRAYNASGVSGASNVATAGTNTPAAPTALAAVTISDTRIDLTWEDNADNEGAYSVERCTGVGCTGFAVVATLPIDAAAYSDLSVVVNTAYRYRVRATNNAGQSDYTAVVDVDTDVPADPASLTATTISATRIDLAWVDASDNEVTFRVERCVGAGCSDFAELVELPPGTQAYADEGLTPDESYSYRVRAVNAAGASAYTAVATATTAIPSDPSGLTATTVSANRIDLSWTDNSSNELQFVVERCDDPTCAGGASFSTTVGANVTAYVDEGVSVGNQYGYRVRAENAAGASGSTPVTVGSTLLPNAPTAVTAVIMAADRVDIGWTDASDNEDEFVVERCEGKECADFAPIGSVPRGEVTYADATVAVATFYSYRVRASNAAGSSDASVAATTLLDAPEPAAGLTATTLSATQAALSWTDASFNETGFLIERCTGAGCGTFAVVDSVGLDVTSYQANDLAFGNSYTFRVVSRNPVAASTASNEATTTTNLADPASGLTAVVVAPNQINLAWTDNSAIEAGFRVERCAGASCTDFAEIGVTGADATGYADVGVSLNTAYTYRVRPFNAVGPSGYSNEAFENTFLPADPGGITATAITVNRIDLTWADNSTNENFFIVEYCATAGCTNFTPYAAVGANVTSYSFTGAVANTIYRARVRAHRSNVGSSGFTTSGDVSTVLNAPSGIRAQTVLRNRVDLTWFDNSAIETGYQLLACAGAGCTPSTVIANLGANVTSYSHTGLSQSQTYSWQVRAVSNATFSASTASAGAYTPVSVGSGTTVAGISDTLNAERYYVINVPAGTPELRITMFGGTGEADLHVRYGQAPTRSLWDCRPYPIGNTESCIIANPAAGDWYFMPHAYQAISGVSVKASLVTRWGYPTAFANTSTWSPNYLLGHAIYVGQAATITHLGLQISSVNPVAPAICTGARVGLYTNNGGVPGTLVTQGSACVLAGTTGMYEIATTQVNVAAGWYWVMWNFQHGLTRFYDSGSSTTLHYISLTYGVALPPVYVVGSSYASGTPNSWVRGYP